MMSQFGKNPPWARDVGPISQALNQSQIGLVSQVYGQPAVAAPTVFSLQPGIALPTSLASSHVATVSYPAPRPAASAVQQKQRVFTGAVTKLHENFGFVDEDVFFQTSCVKGQQPKLGDRVLVEATYNANMPFKWNATRIQVLPTHVQAVNSPQISQAYQAMVAQSSFHTVTPASQASAAFHAAGYKSAAIGSSAIPNLTQPPPPLMSKQTQPVQGRGMNLGQSSRRMESSGFRDRSDRLRERASSRERRDRRSPRKRSRSPLRSKSPRRSRSPRSPSARTKSPLRQRRTARAVSRYTVQIPKISLDLKEANLMILRSRYGNMYVPSDFFSTTFLWVDVFPAHRPFVLGHSCDFHVMQKTVDPPIKAEPPAEPSDADYRFSAKVMLLSCPTMDEIYHKSCALAEDPPEIRESFQHPTRLMQFLVGLKGKGEPMAIGGPWSPSLDGLNPEDDPRCLINTAIRTTKALTGIDLSHCTQWFRFTEIRYYRPEEVRKGRTVPAHVETVVIFLPDVWTCRPTSLEWQTLAAEFKKQLDCKLSTEELKTKEEEVEVEKEAIEDKKDPTHHSELDPKTMKLNDLRQELECRNLSSKGLKSQLIARLTKALRTEEEKEAEETENKCAEEEENREDDEGGKIDADDKEEDSKKLEEEEKLRVKERERANLIRQYTLPEVPSILVRPSTTAKGGKFECSVMSVSLLLDYRPEDNKEHVFEVSLFAEMFNEMLMRDFGFRVYKLLVSCPETGEDEKRDKPKEEDKKDKAKSKDDEKKESSKAKDVEEVKKESDDVEKLDSKRSGKKTQVSSRKDEQQEAENVDDKGEPAQETKQDVKCEAADDENRGTICEVLDPVPKCDVVEPVKMETEEHVSTSLAPKTESGKSLEHLDAAVDIKLTVVDAKAEEDRSRGDDDHEEAKDKKSSRSLVKHDRLKFVTAEPDLLLAFVYFDQSHTGYLLDKDIEEILYTLGLQLSRAQVKKLVSKLASRDMLNYRKLTDVAAEKDEDKDANATVMNDAVDHVDDRTLALGNRRFLPAAETEAYVPPGIPRKRARLEAKVDEEAGSSSSGGVSSDGVVMHNGAFVDINSIMQNLNKSEKSRVSMEAKLKELQQELENIRTSYGLTESTNQTMSSEIQELKKKLRDQRRSLDQAESNAKKYRDLLTRARSTLSTLATDIKDSMTVSDKDTKVTE